MDITEIIHDQHDQQRRLFAQIEEWPKDIEGHGALWKRLATSLETHAEGEERHFYPHLLKKGTGAAGADDGTVEGKVEDAIKDHNTIRDAVRRANEADVGSDELVAGGPRRRRRELRPHGRGGAPGPARRPGRTRACSSGTTSPSRSCAGELRKTEWQSATDD